MDNLASVPKAKAKVALGVRLKTVLAQPARLNRWKTVELKRELTVGDNQRDQREGLRRRGNQTGSGTDYRRPS